MEQRRLPALQLQATLLLFLLTTASSWGFGGQKEQRERPAATVKTTHKLPPSSFVRIFALPSFEATLAQHRLGELLAASCKNHARIGACKLYSAAVDSHHVRILEFEEDGKKAVVAYMLQENEEDAEKALKECSQKHDDKASTQENGKDYRCYTEKAAPPPSSADVLSGLKEQLNKLGVYEALVSAPHRSIFLTADPKQIIYQEAQRLVGDNGDQDFFLQTVRDSFRRIVEWLSWQYQQFSSLTEGTPVLFSHAVDLDNNEKEEIGRILAFLEIEDLHVAQEAVTATRGEIRFQKERLRAAILSLPKALVADIDEFLDETMQDKRMMEKYAGAKMNRTALWPAPTTLQRLAIDNTILATAATCSYAPLVINWIKHIHDLGIPCYLVVALDDEIYEFLHNWVPEHVVRAPPGFTPAVPRQYAAPGTPAMRHLSQARLATLRAVTDQGYHVAWADADVAVLQNIFTIFSRWFDLVVSRSGGKGKPLAQVDKVIGYNLKVDKNDTDRKFSPSFVFLRGSEPARQFLDKWLAAANSSHSVEDGDVLDSLLRDPAVNSALSIQLLPESVFPSGNNLFTNNTQEDYKKAWEKMPPAWAHPDSAKQKEDKIELLASGKYWKVNPEDPFPMCQRPTQEFLADGSVVAVWPPAELLREIEQDGTIMVTSSTCAYADLMTNWAKHVWAMQIKCFLVAAADQRTAEFLQNWVPEHVAQIPAKLVNQVKKFAQKDTPEYTKVVQSKPRIIQAILAQEYNAAWSDADTVWLRNPFTLFDKSPDLVLAWEDNSQVTPGMVLKAGDFPGENKSRKVGTAFIFVRPSALTLKLMGRWAGKLEASKYIDDADALNELLRDPEFQPHLTIGIFPSAVFPTGKEITDPSPSPALKEAWEDDGSKPAWLHADSSASHEGKVKLFKSQDRWLLEKGEPQPKCSTWGRKLGDGPEDEDVTQQSQAVKHTRQHRHHELTDGSQR